MIEQCLFCFENEYIQEEHHRQENLLHLEQMALLEKWDKLPFYNSPKLDNEIMFNAQWDIRHCNNISNAYSVIYKIGKKIATKLIKSEMKRNKHLQLCFSEIEEKAHNCITYIIMQYVQKKDFAITNSFVAYIYLRVQHELYYHTKADEIIDFLDNEAMKNLQYSVVNYNN